MGLPEIDAEDDVGVAREVLELGEAAHGFEAVVNAGDAVGGDVEVLLDGADGVIGNGDEMVGMAEAGTANVAEVKEEGLAEAGGVIVEADVVHGDEVTDAETKAGAGGDGMVHEGATAAAGIGGDGELFPKLGLGAVPVAEGGFDEFDAGLAFPGGEAGEAGVGVDEEIEVAGFAQDGVVEVEGDGLGAGGFEGAGEAAIEGGAFRC